jgi:hypothetical protein
MALIRRIRLVLQYCRFVWVSLWPQILLVLLLGTLGLLRPDWNSKIFDWNPQTGQLDWRIGQVRVPPGYTYFRDAGVDSFVGHFTSADGAVVIWHDIGPYAGEWAKAKDAFEFQETSRCGARIWKSKAVRPDGSNGAQILMALTFPDSGTANFYVYRPTPAAEAALEFLAASYVPKRLGAYGFACQVVRSSDVLPMDVAFGRRLRDRGAELSPGDSQGLG